MKKYIRDGTVEQCVFDASRCLCFLQGGTFSQEGFQCKCDVCLHLKSCLVWKQIQKEKESHFFVYFSFSLCKIFDFLFSSASFYVMGVGGAQFQSAQHNHHQHVSDREGSGYQAIWQEDSGAGMSDSGQLWTHGTCFFTVAEDNCLSSFLHESCIFVFLFLFCINGLVVKLDFVFLFMFVVSSWCS